MNAQCISGLSCSGRRTGGARCGRTSRWTTTRSISYLTAMDERGKCYGNVQWRAGRKPWPNFSPAPRAGIANFVLEEDTA